jgi:hypothetical protein
MTDFAQIWQGAMGALDSTFGRPLEIIPRVGEYIRDIDPTRPAFVRTGVLDERPLSMRQKGGGADKADQSDRIGNKCTIDFDERVFLTPGEVPVAGWHISTVPTAASPAPRLYEVAWRDPDGQGRVVLHVIPL